MPIIRSPNPRAGRGRPRPPCCWPESWQGRGADRHHRCRPRALDFPSGAGCPASRHHRDHRRRHRRHDVDQIEKAAEAAQFVIVDLEGTASLMVASAIGMSDSSSIPAQGASMDAKGAAKTIKLIRNQERMARRAIPHSVLLTRTGAAVATRSLRNVREQLGRAGIDVFETAIVERAAYRDIFDYGGLLADLGAEVSNLARARDNARAFAGEVSRSSGRPRGPRRWHDHEGTRRSRLRRALEDFDPAEWAREPAALPVRGPGRPEPARRRRRRASAAGSRGPSPSPSPGGQGEESRRAGRELAAAVRRGARRATRSSTSRPIRNHRGVLRGGGPAGLGPRRDARARGGAARRREYGRS